MSLLYAQFLLSLSLLCANDFFLHVGSSITTQIFIAMAPTTQSSKKGPKFKYTEEQMISAIQAVRHGMKIRRACTKFSIPKSTLLDKLAGRTRMESRMGRDPYLKKEEEDAIVEWVKRSLQRGFPPHYHDILNTAQNFIKSDAGEPRKTPLVNGRPGKTWFNVCICNNLSSPNLCIARLS